jgi:serine/threonine protein kinase
VSAYKDWVSDQVGDPDKGAFGAVRRVRRLLPGTAVSQVGALKSLRRDADPRHNSLIDAEIDAISRFSSPYVPRYFDSGVDDDGHSWFVVEYIEGKTTLAHFIKDHGPLDEQTWQRFAENITSALIEAHGKGVFHLDIKPDNVMRRSNGDWVLVDFGISGQEFGKPPTLANDCYSAPEQFGNEHEVGFSADMFSLGNLLYFAATARTPFAKYEGLHYTDAVQKYGPSLSEVSTSKRRLLAPLFHWLPKKRPIALAFLDALIGKATQVDVAALGGRIKSWDQLDELVYFELALNQPFGLKLFNTHSTTLNIQIEDVATSPKLLIYCEGANVSTDGRLILSNLGFRINALGAFENRKELLLDDLPDVITQAVSEGFELSLAELSFSVQR